MRANQLRAGVVVTFSALLLAGCNARQEQPQQAAPPAAVQVQPATPMPQVSINAIMVAMVDHAGHELWDVEKEKRAPKTDAAWREIEHHAVQLAAAGPLLTLGGTGPRDATWAQSPSWRAHTEKLSTAALAAIDAVHAKNFESLVKANGDLVDACEGCHKEFKPDLPSEGITHGH